MKGYLAIPLGVVLMVTGFILLNYTADEVSADTEPGVETYTVFFMTNSDYGTVDHVTLIVDSGTPITVAGNKITIGTDEVTAVPIPSTQSYLYYFMSWGNVTDTVQGDMTIIANFGTMLHPYTITLQVDKPAYGEWSEEMVTVPYGTSVVQVRETLTIGGMEVKVILAPNTAVSTYKVSGMTNVPSMVTGDVTITANLIRENNMDAFNIIQPEQSLDETTRMKEGPAWSLVLVIPIMVIVSLIIYAVKFGRDDGYNDF